MTFDLEHDERKGVITCVYHSSNIVKTVYYTKTQYLEVTFAKGREITYHPIDIQTHQKLMIADSIGKAFNTLIKASPKIIFFPGKIEDFIRLQKKKRGY